MEKPKGPPKRAKSLNKFATYSGLGLQMAALIGGCVWLGQFIDSRKGYSHPWFTIALGLLGVFAGIYLAVKPLIADKRE